MIDDAGEVGDNLASVGIVRAHAAEPQAVLLSAVEDGQLGVGDELVPLGCGQAERVAGLFQREEQLGAVGVFPRTRVGRSAPQTDDNRQVLNADRALVFARPAGGALKGRFQRRVQGSRSKVRGGVVS